MLEAWYEGIGGDYREAIMRLKDDRRIEKFLLLFPEDESFKRLKNAMERGDMEEAFEAAHSLKGVAKTLSLKRLGESASLLTDYLRTGREFEAKTEYPIVSDHYEELVKAIENLVQEE